MSTWNKEEMERKAEELSKGKTPVDLDAIAQAIGAVIYKEKLDNDVSGMLLTSGEKKIILVNAKHHENRQRFTIAHEIAHTLMHYQNSDDVFVDSRGSATMYFRSKESMQGVAEAERKANEMASYILMPRSAIMKYINVNPVDFNDDVAVKIMASTFKVSIQAISIRLAKLDMTH